MITSPIKKKLHSLYDKVAVFRQHLQTIESASFTTAMANVARATNQILPQTAISVEEMTELMNKLAETRETVQEVREVMEMEMEEMEKMDDEKLEELLDEITDHPHLPLPPPNTSATTVQVNELPVEIPVNASSDEMHPPAPVQVREMEPVMVTE